MCILQGTRCRPGTSQLTNGGRTRNKRAGVLSHPVQVGFNIGIEEYVARSDPPNATQHLATLNVAVSSEAPNHGWNTHLGATVFQGTPFWFRLQRNLRTSLAWGCPYLVVPGPNWSQSRRRKECTWKTDRIEHTAATYQDFLSHLL